MRAPTEVRPEELREARDAADTLISERFRSYLPGRMLPMLLGKFRDDAAESLGMELPPLPRRSGPVKVVKLNDLTSSELGTLSGAVLVLVTRFTASWATRSCPSCASSATHSPPRRPTVPGSRTSSRAGPGRHDRPRDSPLPLAWLRSSNGTLQCEPGNAATRRSLTGTPKQLSPFSRSGQLAERPVSPCDYSSRSGGAGVVQARTCSARAVTCSGGVVLTMPCPRLNTNGPPLRARRMRSVSA
jgi:hypothetical protein